MRRPLPFAIGRRSLLLVVLGIPFRDMRIRHSPTTACCHPTVPAAQVSDVDPRRVRVARSRKRCRVVLPGAGSPAARAADARRVRHRTVDPDRRRRGSTRARAALRRPVSSVAPTRRVYTAILVGRRGAWLNVFPAVEPVSAQGEALVKAVRVPCRRPSRRSSAVSPRSWSTARPGIVSTAAARSGRSSR